MQLKLGRRELLRYAIAGALSMSTLGVASLSLGRDWERLVERPNYKEIRDSAGNNFAGILSFEVSEVDEGHLWQAGRLPFDQLVMRLRRRESCFEFSLLKSSLTFGTAGVSGILDVRRGTANVAFRITEHSGMQLIANGQVIASNSSPSAKATLSLADRFRPATAQTGRPGPILTFFSEGAPA